MLCGELEIDPLLARVDRDGNTLGELAAARGVTRASLAAAPAWLERIALWLEVHVEQGVALVDVPAPLGVATGLAPRERWRATFEGSANHAGTTPMAGRRDALVAAARTVVAAEELARPSRAPSRRSGASRRARCEQRDPRRGDAHARRAARDGEALARVRDGVFAAAERGDGVEVSLEPRVGRRGLALRRGPARSARAAPPRLPASRRAISGPTRGTTRACSRATCRRRCCSCATRPGSRTTRTSTPPRRTASPPARCSRGALARR